VSHGRLDLLPALAPRGTRADNGPSMPPTRRPPKPAQAPPLPTDRATAPMALEEDTASAWQRFEALQRAHEANFQTTQPASRPLGSGPSRAYAPTQPLDLAEAAPAPAREPAAAPRRSVSLEDLMLIARRNNRACPVPAQWAALHRLLASRASHGGQREAAPPPLEGAAWSTASAMQKRLRLRDQLEWADRAGLLAEVGAFLTGLTEHDWHHFGD